MIGAFVALDSRNIDPPRTADNSVARQLQAIISGAPPSGEITATAPGSEFAAKIRLLSGEDATATGRCTPSRADAITIGSEFVSTFRINSTSLAS
jgi:hypothetical protein